MESITLAFVTGLTTGGISCLLVQCGLLASSIGIDQSRSRFVGTISFLSGKLFAYLILGFGLGLVGSRLIISSNTQGALQIIAGIMMIIASLHLIGLFKSISLSITPPKFLYRIVRKQTNTPLVLGLATVLIPCGVTQAMMTLAIAQGNALTGAGIMAAFTLGTAPYFVAIGVTSHELFKRKAFSYVGAFIVLVVGLSSINTGQILRGSVHTWQNYSLAALELFGAPPVLSAANIGTEGTQEVTINVRSNGYTSNTNAIKKGVPVRLTLSSENTQGCAQAFTIPSLNISTVLPTTGTKVIEFTPTDEGRISYSCAMGMYNGYLEVI